MSCPDNLTLVELRNGIAVLKESIQNEKDGIYEDYSQRLVCGDFSFAGTRGIAKTTSSRREYVENITNDVMIVGNVCFQLSPR
jgi:nitrous oxidase accessory protein NosD